MSYTEGVGNLQLASSIPATKPAPQTTAATDAKVGEKAGAAPRDRAEVSSAAGIVAKALEQSDVRMDKVNALREAIASGSYQVPSDQVADKLIEKMKG